METDFTPWINYFKSNTHLTTINWDEPLSLSKEEFECISHSIAQFQKGESSEAKNLMRQGENQVKDQHDKSYVQALKLFIKEENRHAFELGKFMIYHDIPFIESHWADNIFRLLRKVGTLETTISILLVAEIIATTYYDALEKSTQSKQLIDLCKRILTDEAQHLRFQAVTLAQFNKERGFIFNLMMGGMRKFLLAGATLVVWSSHKKVYKKGGFSFKLFFKESFKILSLNQQEIDLHSYSFTHSYLTSFNQKIQNI